MSALTQPIVRQNWVPSNFGPEFFEISEIASRASMGWRRDDAPGIPEVDLSEDPRPFVDPGRDVRCFDCCALVDGGAPQAAKADARVMMGAAKRL